MVEGELIPARRVLCQAEAENRRLGHENLGFLSESHGFMPIARPRLELPVSHRAWDERAADLPEMFRSLTLRSQLDEMPVLDAGPSALPDADLFRAAAILGIFAHAYHYVEAAPYARIPDSVLVPWEVVSRRLQRPAPHLSFIDLNVYNWRLIDADAPDPMRVENLRLLIPIVGNEDERRFQCTPIEMVSRFTPVVMAVVRAQEAAHRDDPEALARELRLMTDGLSSLTFVSFMKVNPNAESRHYVDPVVWGKTVAPLATPFQPGKSIPGPSGTAVPTFTLMDIFFGRTKFATSVGHETERTRAWFPPHWRAFLEAAERVSVPDYVARRGKPELTGLFQQAMEAYAGELGMIGRHRLKAYGFLDLSFKAGRSKTLGGFDGGFRLWDRMDDQLEYARKERYGRYPESCHFVRIARVEELSGAGAASVRRVVLDIRGTGIRYQPGDRCAIWPENSAELVDKTLRALAATGDEPIGLTNEWRAAVQLRDGYRDARVLSLRTLLTFGRIRPVSRATAKTLHAITHNETLHRVIEARAEDQWELWDLLQLLTEGGFSPKRLRKAAPGEREHLARLVPPETYRMYSISSVMDDGKADELHLTIGQLSYRTADADVSRARLRSGTCSAFLGRMMDAPGSAERRISIKVVHPPRFELPSDPRRPVVVLAGGTGIAPFVGMLQARAARAGGGPNWLFYSTRCRDELHYLPTWQRLAEAGKLELRAAFSREDMCARADAHGVTFAPAARSRIDRLLLAPENAEELRRLAEAGACFYVCGRTGFAKTVMTTMQAILGGQQGATVGREQLFRLVGEDRYLQEIFTTYPGAQFLERKLIFASEVVLHNNPIDGYWMVIGGRVYDVTEFARMHAGGLKVIQSYAGMDATVAYRRAQHDVNPEVDSLTGMFEIGAVRRLDFGSEWGVAVSPKGLKPVALSDLYEAFVRLLYAVVEMENALENDLSIGAEQVTYDEQRGSPRVSPYRLQLRMQTHERFMRDYLSGATGQALEDLWTITCGLCSERLDARWVRQELEAIEATAPAQQTRSLSWERLGTGAGSSLAGLAQLTDVLAQEDRRFLRETKLALRRGVQVFEALERHTLSQGRRPLVEAVRSVPRILADYYARVAGQLS
jgi:sulfite reductase alpha subunit-like flavoprotein